MYVRICKFNWAPNRGWIIDPRCELPTKDNQVDSYSEPYTRTYVSDVCPRNICLKKTTSAAPSSLQYLVSGSICSTTVTRITMMNNQAVFQPASIELVSQSVIQSSIRLENIHFTNKKGFFCFECERWFVIRPKKEGERERRGEKMVSLRYYIFFLLSFSFFFWLAIAIVEVKGGRFAVVHISQHSSSSPDIATAEKEEGWSSSSSSSSLIIKCCNSVS